MSCTADNCTAATAKQGDAFCAEHWAKLPRWARVELVALRNRAGRGSREATRDFLRATATARALFFRAVAEPPK